MAHSARRFGSYEVTTLLDGVFEAPTDVLLHMDGDDARRRLIEGWGDTKIRLDVNCFALRGPNGISLIDVGCGTVWGPAFGKARDALREAGVQPEQVDRVLLTHIHGDHALGLFEGGEPWLPRAEVLVSKTDLAFFTDSAAREAQPERRRAVSTSPRIWCAPMRPAAEFRARPSAGHARRRGDPAAGAYAGHGGLPAAWNRGQPDALGRCAAPAGRADADPDVALIFDVDSALAVRTRRALLERAVQEGWIVGGSHVTGFGRIERAETAFRFVPA